MAEYRRPEEEQAQDEHGAEVREVLERAVHDGASLIVAMDLDEPSDVVDGWVDALWNGLRDNLSDERPARAGLRTEDRLAAIVMLLQDRMQAEADTILRSVREPS
jgi:hypothetical protein